MREKKVVKSSLRKNRPYSESTENKTWRDHLGEAALIASATGLSYTVAFMYELGYCTHMGIPSHLISITATNILVAFSFIVIFCFSLLYSVNIIDALVPFKNHPHLRIRLISLFVLALAIALLYEFRGLSKYFFLLICGMVLIPYILGIIFMKGSFDQRLSEIAEAEKILGSSGTKGFIENNLGSENTGFIVVLFISALISFMVGDAFAGGQREFLSLKDNSQMVLVKSYGDTLIFVEIDESKMRVGSNLLIRKLPADSAPLALQAIRAGPFDKIYFACSEEFKKQRGEFCKK